MKKFYSRFFNIKKAFFTKPLVEGAYKSLPAHPVPDNIIKPSYVDKNGPSGIYEGPPIVHKGVMIDRMRKAGNVAAKTAEYALKIVKEGVTGEDIDKLIHDFIIQQGAYPTPIKFGGFPKSVCISTNEIMCHGIPNLRPFENGDYTNIDISVYIDGVHGDNSVMVEIGEVHPDVKRLIKATQLAVYESIKICKPGVKFSEIGNICQEVAHESGFHSTDLFNGHGIGELLHLPPQIIHVPNDYKGVMEPGNTFTIEPIFTMYPLREVYMWKDNWTVICPNNPSAQWEHTVLITENGHEVITKREGEKIE